MTTIDAQVIIVGAAPTGLMLAAELCLTGVRPLVIDRLTEVRAEAKAGGIGGRILDLMDYRAVGERIRAAGSAVEHGSGYPFGGLHVDMSGLAEPPMRALLVPQPELEALLGDYVTELGAQVRRGHEVTALRQDDGGVTLGVRGPDASYEVRASYVVGCDGVGSRVRELAGIPYVGETYPEIHRLGSTTVPDGVSLRADGDYDVEGFGLLRFGYTQTQGGVLAIGSTSATTFGVYTCEPTHDARELHNGDAPMTLQELSDSIERVLGVRLPLGEPTRLTRFTYGARNAQRYRDRRVLLAGDAAHRFPSGGVALNAGMIDAVNLGWKLGSVVQGRAEDGLLDSYHDERHFAAERTLLHTRAQVALRRGHDEADESLRKVFAELMSDEQATRRIGAMIAGSDIRYPTRFDTAGGDHPLVGAFAPNLALRTEAGSTTVGELMHPARPVLLDLGARADTVAVARDWAEQVGVVSARADDPPADALLIRPDGHVAWAGGSADGLRDALSYWFGEVETVGNRR